MATSVLGACRGPALPPGHDGAASQAFQREHEALFRGESSPLTTIAAHYLGPRETIDLSRVGRTVSTDRDAGVDPVALAVDREFACVSGCGEHTGAVARPIELPWGPLRLALAPQPTGDDPGGRVLVRDPEAPAVAAFPGLAWFPVSERFIVPAVLEPAATPETVVLTTSRGLAKPFELVGTLVFSLAGTEQRLLAYRSASDGAWLVPFTDHTTGDTTYPVGRYLELEPLEHGALVLDFNRSTQPWCAQSPHYNCPVPPRGNRLELAVEAGERLLDAHAPG